MPPFTTLSFVFFQAAPSPLPCSGGLTCCSRMTAVFLRILMAWYDCFTLCVAKRTRPNDPVPCTPHRQRRHAQETVTMLYADKTCPSDNRASKDCHP